MSPGSKMEMNKIWFWLLQKTPGDCPPYSGKHVLLFPNKTVGNIPTDSNCGQLFGSFFDIKPENQKI